MGRRRGWVLAAFLMTGIAMAPEALALSLVRMNVGDMTRRAGAIFRGTVLEKSEGTMEAGGGRLPVTTYRVRVEEAFKGQPAAGKKDQVVELRMLGVRQPVKAGTTKSVVVLRDLPRLEVGGSYLLFSTQPSAIGLSTTVGLGQGCFRIHGGAGQEKAVNLYDNVGLFTTAGAAAPDAARGPVAYDRLAAAIRAELAGQ